MDMVIKRPERFDVYLVNLSPTVGSEIQKTRPCVVISPNEMNRYLRTCIIAPMTSAVKGYPSRVAVKFQGKQGEVALDQLRTVDRERLIQHLGSLEKFSARAICNTLLEMFTP